MKTSNEYAELIARFLNKNISVQEFETVYLKKFKEEKHPLTDEEFDALDWLFAEVDAYTDLPFDLNDNQYGWINEDQLRASAEQTLRKLQVLK